MAQREQLIISKNAECALCERDTLQSMAEGIGLLTGGALDQTQRGRKLENLGDDVVTKVGEGGRSDGR